jgi:hypothetical protein
VNHTEKLLPQCENRFVIDTAKFAVDKAESFIRRFFRYSVLSLSVS